jgi:hypothetical protein
MNDMRKLMEAVEQLDETTQKQHLAAVTALVDLLAQDVVDSFDEGTELDIAMKNAVHMVTADIKTRLPERVLHYNKYRESYNATYGIEEDGNADPAQFQHSEQQKSAFISGWEWALATDWNDQLDSETGYVNWASGKPKPDNY